jgi:hypothetical protein
VHQTKERNDLAEAQTCLAQLSRHLGKTPTNGMDSADEIGQMAIG